MKYLSRYLSKYAAGGPPQKVEDPMPRSLTKLTEPPPTPVGVPLWDQAAADALVVEVQSHRRQLFGEDGWPAGRATRRRLGELMDRFDDRWLARDPAGLRRAADELLALLLPADAGDQVPVAPADLPDDWHEVWGERAAIQEYDGGLSREQAEAGALADVLRQMGTPEPMPHPSLQKATWPVAPGT
jgi:hypothetical protein